MAVFNDAAIPQGLLVLVTGATGFLASHVVRQFLEMGYRVRGTVRSMEKAAFLSQGPFEKYAKNGALELVTVPDLFVPGAYDGIVKNVSAIVHVAAILTFEPDPSKVVTPNVDGMHALLKAAAAEPSVKRVTFCSTVGAAFVPMAAGGTPGVYTKDSWNETSVKEAFAPPPYLPQRAMHVYSASKVLAEKAALEFVAEHKPGFVFNVVNPYTMFGPIHDRSHLASTTGALVGLFHGDARADLRGISALGYVHVADIAALHVAATLDPDVENERILAWAEPANANVLIDRCRKLFPDREFPGPVPNQGDLAETIDETLPLRLLKKWAGRDGWIPMEQAVREMEELAGTVEWPPK